MNLSLPYVKQRDLKGATATKANLLPPPWQEYYAPNIFEAHGYFDGKIIDYVGVENYEAWVQAHLNTPEGADVYLFFEDFGITPEVLKEIVHESTYELYIESWPTD